MFYNQNTCFWPGSLTVMETPCLLQKWKKSCSCPLSVHISEEAGCFKRHWLGARCALTIPRTVHGNILIAVGGEGGGPSPCPAGGLVPRARGCVPARAAIVQGEPWVRLEMRLRVISPHFLNTWWQRVLKKMEIFFFFYWMSWQSPARSCCVSILGDAQPLPEGDPEQLVAIERTRQSPEVPSNLSYSVIPY